jgi:spore germination protein GerM
VTPRQANVLTALGLAGLLATVALTAPRWAALLRSPAASVEADEAPVPEETPGPTAEAESAGRRISVRLYFEAPDREGLLPEEREIAFSPDLALQLRTVVEELAKGSTTGLLATIPPGTRVLEVFVQARGVAHVDLSGEAAAGLPGGSRAELLTVYSIVNTIVTNFPSVSRVLILVDDRPVDSLGGHVDLSRPLAPDMTLVALPVAAGEPSPLAPLAPTPSPGEGARP